MADRYTAIATYTGSATSSYIKGYVVTAEYSGTVSRIALNKVRYVAIFEGTKPRPAHPPCRGSAGSRPALRPGPPPRRRQTEAPVQFHWAYVLAPLGVVAAIGAGVGAALFIKKRRESGYETEEDNCQ